METRDVSLAALSEVELQSFGDVIQVTGVQPGQHGLDEYDELQLVDGVLPASPQEAVDLLDRLRSACLSRV